MKLSIIIPHYNEKTNLGPFCKKLSKINFIKNYEVLFIDDYSTDGSKKIQDILAKSNKNLKFLKNKFKKGLGGTINTGILKSKGKFITFMMCDSSDSIEDLQRYYTEIQTGNYDAILGSRFTKSFKIINYPIKKLILNRIFNYFIKIIFLSDYNDFTNAFKIYKREKIFLISPFFSENFNIFLEIPLKIISKNYKYKIIPIKWENNRIGKSNFKIKELGSKYFYTLARCFLEKYFIIKN